MVTKWGLSDKMGPLMYDHGSEEVFLGRSAASDSKSMSSATAQLIEEEVRSIADECYQRATEILVENRDKLEAMPQALMTYETIDAHQIDDIMEGKTPRKPESWDDDQPSAGDSSSEEKDVSKKADGDSPVGGPLSEH
jgi:cell division protease FtsH